MNELISCRCYVLLFSVLCEFIKLTYFRSLTLSMFYFITETLLILRSQEFIKMSMVIRMLEYKTLIFWSDTSKLFTRFVLFEFFVVLSRHFNEKHKLGFIFYLLTIVKCHKCYDFELKIFGSDARFL